MESIKLDNPNFGRGPLMDYTKKRLGKLKGKGVIVVCPKCGKRGIERSCKTSSMYIHSDQPLNMLGLLTNEIKEFCHVKNPPVVDSEERALATARGDFSTWTGNDAVGGGAGKRKGD